MAITPATLSGYLDAFATYVDAGSWNSAEVELLKAEAVLQALPSTDRATWRGTLMDARKMLEDVRARSEATTGTLVWGALRRKSRSQRSDGT